MHAHTYAYTYTYAYDICMHMYDSQVRLECRHRLRQLRGYLGTALRRSARADPRQTQAIRARRKQRRRLRRGGDDHRHLVRVWPQRASAIARARHHHHVHLYAAVAL
jgi:hypothetical protein